MSMARRSGSSNPGARSRTRTAAILLAAATALSVCAGPATALGTDNTPGPENPPPPTPTAPGAACPLGQVAQVVTIPPPAAGAKPPKLAPDATTRPDGDIVQTVCTIAPPAPIVSPAVAAAHAVGGPKLAAGGVVVDKPATVLPPPDVAEVSYVIADMESGAVLAAKNPHVWLPPASTLKTLTSLVVMPTLDPNAKVTATDDEVKAEGTRVGLVSGGQYSVGDLFHGLIMVSGNDSAYALADAYGGRDKTIAAMNAKAAELGAWDTAAVDPSGLDADKQHSSAYDLALFGRAVMQLPAYRGYATAKTYDFPGATDRTGKQFAGFQIQNHNTLLEHYQGAFGVKNGYTTGARNTFIGAATRGGRTLVVSEMGGTYVPTWQATAVLLDWAFANAGQLNPVGTLVTPGAAAQPPELGGVPVPTTAGTPSPSQTTEGPTPTQTGTTTPTTTPTQTGTTAAPVAGGEPPSSAGGNPAPELVTSLQSAVQSPVTYAVVVLLLAALLLVRRRGRVTRQQS